MKYLKIEDVTTYDEYLKSDYWQLIKQEVTLRDEGCCQICGKTIVSFEEFIKELHKKGKNAINTTYPEIHHMKYPNHWELDHPRNCVLLCGFCHFIIHQDGVSLENFKLIKQKRVPGLKYQHDYDPWGYYDKEYTERLYGR